MPPDAFQLGCHSKAEVLAFLRDSGFDVPPLIHFTTRQWAEAPETAMQQVADAFDESDRVAVRSSCSSEDTCQTSNAGRFRSVLDVAVGDGHGLREAVETVIASYPTAAPPGDQVLVQQMVSDPVMSGVIMTRVADDGAPYYVLNYDDETCRTDAVTSGSRGSKTVYVYRGFRNSDFDSPRLMELVYLARRIEAQFDHDALDIEFCRDDRGTVHLLQVRPIAVNLRWSPDIVAKTANGISFVEDFVNRLDHPRPGIFGERTIFGVMPDWNPAEIIGVTPRPLATSLYRYLITQRTWSLAREQMGYRHMPPEELMIIIAGRPYIDVRCSFNSFLAAGLSDETSRRLVDAWIQRLDRHPELHDKVEFSVVPTVCDFAFRQTYAERYPGLLDHQRLEEVQERYRVLTRRNLSLLGQGSLQTALACVKVFEQRLGDTGRAWGAERQPYVLLARVRHLLESCRNSGTLPFSIIARHAFMAEALIRSAVRRGASSEGRFNDFKSSIKTVTTEFSADLMQVSRDRLSADDFMARYGHLRPGTYDILSPRYADRPEVLHNGSNGHQPATAQAFRLMKDETRDLQSLMTESGLVHVGPDELFEYARTSIAGREYAKFVFTRGLSDAIEILSRWGELVGLSRDDLSWLNIDDLLNVSVCPPLNMPRDHFAPLMAQGQRISAAGKDLKLGYVIRSSRDVYVVPQHRSTPNWVTRQRVEGPVVRLSSKSRGRQDLHGRIICIENADPGYDWVFSRGIAGLVTQFGGANSHMSIRCSENKVPAAVGCGHVLFDLVAAAERCELDAERQILRPL